MDRLVADRNPELGDNHYSFLQIICDGKYTANFQNISTGPYSLDDSLMYVDKYAHLCYKLNCLQAMLGE